MGLGVTPLYSLGYAHLDAIVERGKNSMYFSIMGAFSAIGPALGFFLANPILNIFVDLKQVGTSLLLFFFALKFSFTKCFFFLHYSIMLPAMFSLNKTK